MLAVLFAVAPVLMIHAINPVSRRASRDCCLPQVIMSSSRLPGLLATPLKSIAPVDSRTKFVGYILFQQCMKCMMANAAASTAKSEISALKDNTNQQQ
jgi:hypothetical protein